MKNILKASATVAKLREEFAAVETGDIISVSVDRGIHLTFEEFRKHFKPCDYEVQDFTIDKYRLMTLVNGVDVFALADIDEYKIHFPTDEQQRIKELEAEIEELKQTYDEMGLNDEPQPYKIGGN